MKKVLFGLLAVLMLAGCTPEPQELPTEPEAPTTKTVYVHSSITRTQGESTSRTEYVYDDQSCLTDVVIYDGENQPLQQYLVTCDETGNPIRWHSESVGSAVTYAYDAKGHTLGTYTYTGETLMSSTEYTWSGDLRLSLTVKTPAQEQRTEYTYDDNGTMTRQDVYMDGQLTGYGLFTCGEDGKPVLCESFDPEGNVISTVEYQYEGTQETRVTKAEGLVTQTQIMSYDAHGNLLSNRLLDANGSQIFSETHVWQAIEVPLEAPRASV